ncbi:hypothetical protein MMC13_004347 [Lambiella insularis]|nr:hypothetical protein [Lambiella insularis]
MQSPALTFEQVGRNDSTRNSNDTTVASTWTNESLTAAASVSTSSIDGLSSKPHGSPPQPRFNGGRRSSTAGEDHSSDAPRPQQHAFSALGANGETIESFDAFEDPHATTRPTSRLAKTATDLALFVDQLRSGSSTWTTNTTRSDSIKTFALTGLQLSFLVVLALYGIATITISVLICLATSAPNPLDREAVEMQRIIGNQATKQNSNLANLIELQTSENAELGEVLDALHEMVSACVPNKVSASLFTENFSCKVKAYA